MSGERRFRPGARGSFPLELGVFPCFRPAVIAGLRVLLGVGAWTLYIGCRRVGSFWRRRRMRLSLALSWTILSGSQLK
eukprot:7062072-Pyramimonas_sp.AAC.1